MAKKTKVMKPADSSVPTVSNVDMPENYLLDELEGNKHVDKKIKEMVRNFILNDKDIDKEIEKVVEKIENGKVKVFLTKIAFGIWSLLMILFGAILPVLISWVSGGK